MLLGLNRDEDGVITVHARASDGRTADVADFWLRPLIENFGLTRQEAADWQRNFAELLVTVHNKHVTPIERRGQEPRIDEETKGDAPPAHPIQPDGWG